MVEVLVRNELPIIPTAPGPYYIPPETVFECVCENCGSVLRLTGSEAIYFVQSRVRKLSFVCPVCIQGTTFDVGFDAEGNLIPQAIQSYMIPNTSPSPQVAVVDASGNLQGATDLGGNRYQVNPTADVPGMGSDTKVVPLGAQKQPVDWSMTQRAKTTPIVKPLTYDTPQRKSAWQTFVDSIMGRG